MADTGAHFLVDIDDVAADLAIERFEFADFAEALSNAASGFGSDDDVEPAQMRCLGFRGEDLDHIAGLEVVAKRYHAAIDAGSDTVVSDFGVDEIGEIEWGSANREFFDLTFWREDVDVCVAEIAFDVVDDFGGRRCVLNPLVHLPEPFELRFEFGIGFIGSFFV